VKISAILGTPGVTFETGSSTLSARSDAELLQVAAVLAKSPALTVTVAGYTDNTGPLWLNQELSLQRARVAVAYLVGHGVAASRLTAKGYGPSDPIATNATAAGRAENRRIELTVQGG
jgi:outer membrane protein OmpA-like peptidoglycan-associated protein